MLYIHHEHWPNSRLIKQVVFGMVDGTGIRGRPTRAWLDMIKEWCQMDVHSASLLAQSRIEWRKLVGCVVDTNGHWAHGSMYGWMDIMHNTKKVFFQALSSCYARRSTVYQGAMDQHSVRSAGLVTNIGLTILSYIGQCSVYIYSTVHVCINRQLGVYTRTFYRTISNQW